MNFYYYSRILKPNRILYSLEAMPKDDLVGKLGSVLKRPNKLDKP